MQEIQRQILELVHASGEVSIEDETVSERLKIALEEVRFYLSELQSGGFVELHTSRTYEGDSYIATGVTPRGFMVLQKKLKLEDRADSKLSLNTFHIRNEGNTGAQLFGDRNVANVTQNNRSDMNEILQLVDTLKQLVETIPSSNREVAIDSLSLVEEEIINPTAKMLVIVKTGLFALWSIGKDTASFANAVTALAQRFGIHFPG